MSRSETFSCPARARIESLTGPLPPLVWRAARAGSLRYERPRHAAPLVGTALADGAVPGVRVLDAIEAAVVAQVRRGRRRPWAVRPGRLIGLLAAFLAERRALPPAP